MTTSSIHEDELADDIHEDDGEDLSGAANAFLSKWDAAKKRPSGDAEEKGETDAEEGDDASVDDDEAEDRTDEGEEDQKDPNAPKPAEKATEKRSAGDDDEVAIKVGDKEHRVSVKDLKRLFGQEASLTQKSQDLAANNQRALDQIAKAEAGVKRLLDKAATRLKPYANIDWVIAAKEYSTEDLKTLREDA